jgi:hypothetical protein
MKIVAFNHRPARSLRNRLPKSGLAATGNSHDHNNAWRQVARLTSGGW